jgi:hypothetical protein
MAKTETVEHRRMRHAEDERDMLGEELARAKGDASNVRGRLDVSRARVVELERRLAQYECIEHPTPLFGECDECDKHNPEPKEVLGAWT